MGLEKWSWLHSLLRWQNDFSPLPTAINSISLLYSITTWHCVHVTLFQSQRPNNLPTHFTSGALQNTCAPLNGNVFSGGTFYLGKSLSISDHTHKKLSSEAKKRDKIVARILAEYYSLRHYIYSQYNSHMSFKFKLCNFEWGPCGPCMPLFAFTCSPI